MKRKNILITTMISVIIISCGGGNSNGVTPISNNIGYNNNTEILYIDDREKIRAPKPFIDISTKTINDFFITKNHSNIQILANVIGKNALVKTTINGVDLEYNKVRELITNSNKPHKTKDTTLIMDNPPLNDPNRKTGLTGDNLSNKPTTGANIKYTGKGVTVAFFDEGFDRYTVDEYITILRNRGEVVDNNTINLLRKYDLETNLKKAGIDYEIFSISEKEKFPLGLNHGYYTTSSSIDVAPKANLFLVHISGNATGYLDTKSRHFQEVINRKIKVANFSYGYSTNGKTNFEFTDTWYTPDYYTNEAKQNYFMNVHNVDLKNYIKSGGLAVLSSGNNEPIVSPYYNSYLGLNKDVEKGFIVVNGLKYNGDINAFSKRKTLNQLTLKESISYSPFMDQNKYNGITARSVFEEQAPYKYSKYFQGGTSLAAPQVTGTAVLLLEKYPWMSNENLKLTILTTASDIGEKGVDNIFGWGLLDIDKALNGPKYLEPNIIYTQDKLATFNITGVSVFSNNIEGEGGLRKKGNGTLVLAGDNQYTGKTIIDEGELYLKDNSHYSEITNNSILTLDKTNVNNIISNKNSTINIKNENNANVVNIKNTTINVDSSSKLNINDGTIKDSTLTFNNENYTNKIVNMPIENAKLENVNTISNNEFFDTKLENNNLVITRKEVKNVLMSNENSKVVGENLEKLFDSADNDINKQEMVRILQNNKIKDLETLSGQIYSSSQNLTIKEQEYINKVISNKLNENVENNVIFTSISSANSKDKNQGFGDNSTKTLFNTIGYMKNKNNLTYGISFNYGESKMNFDKTFGKTKTNSKGINVFSKYKKDNLYLKNRLGVNFVENKTERKVLTNDVITKRNDIILSGNLETGYTVTIKNTNITPYTKLDFINAKIGKINENTLFGIKTDKQSKNILTTTIGLNLEKQINNFTLNSYVEGGKIFNRNTDLTGKYIGIDENITIKGNELSKYKFNAGVGFGYNLNKQLNISFNYDYNKETNKNSHHLGTFGILFEF